MTAIEMLKKQHREVAGLFDKLEGASSAGQRREIFNAIADALAVHATIEERHFYPAVKNKATDDMLLEAVEEHLEIKRAIAELLQLDAGDKTFAAQAMMLRDEVEQHVEEEESELFPVVEDMFDDETLEALAEAMDETQTELLAEGNPRDAIPGETERAAPL
jgi:hemerythrin-like domain-containing protein